MNKGKKINGILDVDSPEMARTRAIVIEQELTARSFKAVYDKMYYALEIEKLEPAYHEYVERRQKQMAESKAQIDALNKALQEEIAKQGHVDPSGDIKIEEAN